MDDLTGYTLGKYKLYFRLGTGGMARVYKAYQPSLERYVAVKVMHSHLAEEEEFVGRFEREASAVARLRHPHIVQVHDFDVEGELYYMVMEFIDGPTLKAELDVRTLDAKSFTLEEVATILSGLAGAVDYAHVRGMIHRDIKPANIMFTGEGQVVLADFGIARLRGLTSYTIPGMIAGTPTYMPPEQGKSEISDARSDIYSLGIILYEMLTGRPPFRGDSALETIQQHIETPVPPLSTFDVTVPTAVEQVVFKALAKEPDDRYQRAREMARAFQTAIGLTTEQLLNPAPVTTVAEPRQIPDEPFTPVHDRLATAELLCPYQGLYAFGEESAANFYGREAFTDRLVAATHQQAMVAVVGPSGSGKSSVVFAGLIPQLRQEQQWQIISFRPGSHPFKALASALVPALEPEMSHTDQLIQTGKLADALRQGDVKLHDVIQRIVKHDPHIHRLLLVSDQFEEIYTLCADADIRRAFLDALLETVDIQKFHADPTFTFVLTLRTDFLSQALTHRPFADALQDADIKLGPMTRRELSRAISNPARRYGILFETGLVARILDDVGDEPGNLPLLEFALTELWEKQRDGRLTHAGYEAIGEVEGALARYAERVFGELNAAEKQQARQIFIQMVRPGAGTEDTRRLATRAELGRENWQLVQKLADARLVVTSRDPSGQETVEVVHEALIRGWAHLRAWMEEDRAFRAWQERLRAALQQWQLSEQDDSALLRGVLLAEAEGWTGERDAYLSREEKLFIKSSLKLRQQRQAAEERERLERQQAEANARYARRLGRLAAALGVAIVVALFLAISAARNSQAAQQNAATAVYNEQAALSAQRTAEASEAEVALAAATARADASLRSTAEADADQQRQIAEEERDAAEQSALEAQYAEATAVAIADELATAVEDAETSAEEAEMSAAVAEAQSREVIARELASIAIDQLNSDPQLGLLLALEAINITLPYDQEAPAVAEDTLFRALQASQLQRTLPGHTDWINDVAFSPDGRLLATVSRDTDVKVWDVTTGQELFTLGDHARVVNAIAFSPDGTRLATAGNDGFVILWDLPARQLITVFDHGQNNSVNDIAFSPDGQFLVAATDVGTGRVWNTLTRRPELTVSGHTDSLTGVAYSPNGLHFATAGEDGRIIMWQAELGASIFSIEPEIDSNNRPIAITGLAFNPQGTRLISANENGIARVWDANTAELILTLSGHARALSDVTFSPDGALMGTASEDGTAKVWDATTGQPLFTLSGHDSGVTAIAFSPDKTQIATASQDTTAKIWNAESGLTPLILTGHRAPILSLAISADGALIATASSDDTVRIWDAKTGLEAQIFADHNAAVNDVAFQPNGSLVATASDDYNARLWNLTTGDLLRPLLVHSDLVNGVAFHPDGSVLATASEDGGVRLWDVNTLNFIQRFDHEVAVNKVAFNGDGSSLAAATADGSVVIWDMATGTAVTTLTAHEGPVNQVTFSQDGTLLATAGGDGTAKVWQLANQELLRTFSGHTGPVLAVTFNEDGSQLATGSVDRTVKLWDTNTGQTLRTFFGHTSAVNAVLFDPNGEYLASASSDRTANLNQLETVPALFERAQLLLTRRLTADECAQYLSGRPCLFTDN